MAAEWAHGRAQRTGLHHDLSIVHSYGAQHHGSYGGMRVDDGQITVSFTERLEEHRAALSSQLEDPSELVVELGRYSRSSLDLIRAEIAASWAAYSKGPPPSLGFRYNKVAVTVAASQLLAARKLHSRYGPALDITVGFKPYPAPRRVTALPLASPPQNTLALSALDLVAVLSTDRVRAGDDATGEVWLSNTGDSELTIETGSVVAGGIQRPGSNGVSGWFSGGLLGTGMMLTLPAGSRRPIRLIVGTASCESDHRYVPRRGSYEVVVAIHATVSSTDVRTQSSGVLVARGPQLTLT